MKVVNTVSMTPEEIDKELERLKKNKLYQMLMEQIDRIDHEIDLILDSIGAPDEWALSSKNMPPEYRLLYIRKRLDGTQKLVLE